MIAYSTRAPANENSLIIHDSDDDDFNDYGDNELQK